MVIFVENFTVFYIFNLECFLIARVSRVSELYERRVSDYTGCCYQKERKKLHVILL